MDKLENEMNVGYWVKLVVDNKLDYLRIGEIEIKKSNHITQKDLDEAAQRLQKSSKPESDDDDLYYSAV